MCDDKIKFEAAIKKAYHEHRETQIALQQAQAKIADTRSEIKDSILKTKKTMQFYKEEIIASEQRM